MIVDFKDKKNTSKVGNKAKFLMEMKANGFQVPDGFVIDSDTYLEEIKNNNLEDDINKLLKKLNTENISEISKEIISLFDSFVFSKTTIDEVEKRLKDNNLYN